MKISILGTGYVGLVTGTCLAEMGSDVTCIDIDHEKVEKLKQGIIPIFEPGLEELVKRNTREGRLTFTTNIKEGIEKSLLLFIAVDTPSRDDSSPDLTKVETVARSIGKYMDSYKIVINKSTVPVGTAEKVREIINEELQLRVDGDTLYTRIEFDMVSNPEFLKEGAAVEDFMKPDRVVIGTDNVRTAEIMKELYSPFVRNEHPIIIMDIKSAEMTKYAANAFLATKISFINEIANLCELVGADVANVRKGLMNDSRIGSQFLFPGVGFGGSCFPKDIKILNHMAKSLNYSPHIFEAVNKVNENQKSVLVAKILHYYKRETEADGNLTPLNGLTFGIWGLSFKPHTDDIREAPSIVIIQSLIKKGAKIKAYDPEAVESAQRVLGSDNIEYCNNMYSALEGADAMVLITEWPQFRKPDLERVKGLLKKPVIFDGRNQYEPEKMKAQGFKYFCIGRAAIL